MKIGVLVNLVNVILNFFPDLSHAHRVSLLAYLPLFGAGLGVTGAAIASAVAFTVGGICISVVLWRHPTVSPRGQAFRPDMQILKPCMRVAFPNMLQRFGTSLGYVAFAAMINSLGEVATAAHTIANTVESAFISPVTVCRRRRQRSRVTRTAHRDEKRMKSLASMFIPLKLS